MNGYLVKRPTLTAKQWDRIWSKYLKLVSMSGWHEIRQIGAIEKSVNAELSRAVKVRREGKK